MPIILSANCWAQCGLKNMGINKDTLPVLQELCLEGKRAIYLLYANHICKLPNEVYWGQRRCNISIHLEMSLEVDLRESVQFSQGRKEWGEMELSEEFGTTSKFLQKCEKTYKWPEVLSDYSVRCVVLEGVVRGGENGQSKREEKMWKVEDRWVSKEEN